MIHRRIGCRVWGHFSHDLTLQNLGLKAFDVFRCLACRPWTWQVPKEEIVASAVNATVNVVQMYGCSGVALLGKVEVMLRLSTKRLRWELQCDLPIKQSPRVKFSEDST